MLEPESTTRSGNGLDAFDEKLLHFQFACPLIARTVSIVPNIQNTLDPVHPCLFLREPLGADGKHGRLSGKVAADQAAKGGVTASHWATKSQQAFIHAGLVDFIGL
jgi:hypothetical protein